MTDTENGLRALEAQLAGSVPPGVAQLDDRELRHLADSVRAARHRQAAELAAAGDQALRYIPRLLRGPIRKIVG